MKICYADAPENARTVTPIAMYRRGEVKMVMSASSGPKDYF